MKVVGAWRWPDSTAVSVIATSAMPENVLSISIPTEDVRARDLLLMVPPSLVASGKPALSLSGRSQ